MGECVCVCELEVLLHDTAYEMVCKKKQQQEIRADEHNNNNNYYMNGNIATEKR